MRGRWRIGGATLLGLLLGAAPLAAQGRLQLRWDAPASCPGAEAVEREVARLLGGAVPAEGPVIRAEARAREEDRGFVLEVRTEVEGAHGARVLEAERCDELAAAAALILALMIDPDALARIEPAPSAEPGQSSRQLGSPRPTGAPEVVERAAAGPEPDREPGRDPQASSDATLTSFVGGGLVVEVGTVPSVTPGVALEVGAGVPLFDARVRAVFLFPQGAVNEAELAGVRAELMALSAGLVGCLRPIEELRALGLCAEVSAGAVFGSAQGVSVPRFGAGLWMAAGGGLALTWQPLAWLDVELTGMVLGQLASPAFDVIVGSPTGERRVVFWEPPGVTGRFSLAAHVRF